MLQEGQVNIYVAEGEHNKCTGCHFLDLVPPTQSKEKPQKKVVCALKVRNVKRQITNVNNVQII